MKKSTKTMALGLMLAMGITAVGSASPKTTMAAGRTVIGTKGQPSGVAMLKLEEGGTSTSDQNTGDWQLDGGWVVAEDHSVTDKIRKMVQDSFRHVMGVRRKPIAYIGYQVVAGTNHCILCKRSAVIPNPVYSYELLYIYEDLDGNCKITNTKQVDDVSEFAEYVDPGEFTQLTLNKTSVKMKKGRKVTLKTTVTYGTGDEQTIIWKTSNKKVATVKNGVITAKKKGTCTISCEIKGLPDTLRFCYVTVK